MTKEKNRELIQRYPYLQPRNVWTDKIDEEYDYSYIRGIGELPRGWERLFLQMCEDIREPLSQAGCLEKFRFTQIKEKYNTMRCYCNGAPEEVLRIIDKYEYMSQYVCTRCGKPATYETHGYIESFCDDCWRDFVRHTPGEFIKFNPHYKVTTHYNGVSQTTTISFEEEWNRYIANTLGVFGR